MNTALDSVIDAVPASIELNKAHFPVTVLGPGRRIGIWFQGCSIGCTGCISQDTWSPDASKSMDVPTLLAWCREVAGGALDGVTISGGEPFEQPVALAALLDGLHAWRAETSADFDILCYSGLPLRRLRAEHRPILERLDAVIPEPYVDSLPLGKVWRGSTNQSLVPLSARGETRYASFVDAPAGANAKRIQVAVEPDRIWYIGIPDRDDMARVVATCRERGLVFVKNSWR